MLHSVLCQELGPASPTQREGETDKRVHVRDMRKTNKHANGNDLGRQNYRAHFYLSYDLTDYRDRPTYGTNPQSPPLWVFFVQTEIW